ncbi:hypothetical protein B0H14DRAFT_3041107, partial [Mycena olivaceomarginata]
PPHSYSSPLPAASEAFAPPHQPHLVSFGKDDTICVRQPSYSSPTSTHSTHAVAFPRVAAPIRLRAHGHADVHLDAPTADAAWDAAHGMERVVPARACAHVTDVWWEAEVEREGEGAESCERIVSLLPPLCLVCIGDANNDTMSDPGAAGSFPLRGRAGGGR